MTTLAPISLVMTTCPHSIGIDQDADIARRFMREHGFHHLPVREEGRVVGVVSDRDLKFASGWEEASGKKMGIRDLYIPNPYTVPPDAPLRDVLRLMAEQQIGCVLIEEKEKLLGIFTVTDACRFFAEYLDRDEKKTPWGEDPSPYQNPSCRGPSK